MLIRNLSERGGTGKLRSHWEKDVYTVVEKKNDSIPVYTVVKENGKGVKRTVHRNLLMPCDHLPVELPDETSKKLTRKAKPTPRTRDSSHITKQVPDESDSSEDELFEGTRWVATEMLSKAIDDSRGTNVEQGEESGEAESEEDDMVDVDEGSRADSDSAVGDTSAGESNEGDSSDSDSDSSNGSNAQRESDSDSSSDQSSDSGDSQNTSNDVSDSDVQSGNNFPRRGERVRNPRKVYTYDEFGTPVYR